MGYMQQGILALGVYRPDITTPMNEAADFQYEFTTLDGNTLNLSTIQGRVILINLWATWCPPCRAELPDLEGLFETKEGAEIFWIMASLDQDREKAAAFFEDKNYPWEVYFPTGPLPSFLESSAIPTTVVIDSQGKVVVKKEGMAQYNTQEFREFLANL